MEWLVTLALGTIFGMLVWDLVFEMRAELAEPEITAAQSYYRGLHTAPFPLVLVLPVSVLVVLAYFGMRAGSEDVAGTIALAAVVAAVVIEIAVAVPAERRLFRTLGPVGEASPETLDSMRRCIRAARNVHLVMVGLVLLAAVLV